MNCLLLPSSILSCLAIYYLNVRCCRISLRNEMVLSMVFCRYCWIFYLWFSWNLLSSKFSHNYFCIWDVVFWRQASCESLLFCFIRLSWCSKKRLNFKIFDSLSSQITSPKVYLNIIYILIIFLWSISIFDFFFIL